MVSPSSSLLGLSDNDEGEHEYQDHPGDYSARMDELFADQSEGDGEGSPSHSPRSGGIEVTKATYRERLRDVLGSEATGEDDDADELGHSPSHGNAFSDDEHNEQPTSDPRRPVIHVEHAEAALSDPPSSAPSTTFSPGLFASPLPALPNMKAPFLHPTISRLRSSLTQAPSQSNSIATSNSQLSNEHSPESSHFSALSNDRSTAIQPEETPAQPGREVFQWTPLNAISNFVYSPKASKALNAMGTAGQGVPTVMAANGLICVGTETGCICVFDFKQNLKCLCGTDAVDVNVGAVTSLALSHDHTWVASGHASGHVRVFDLNKPGVPARVVPPTSPAAVKGGRREGHFPGTAITSIGFVAGRHTAIVTADENGLAFYHSLGKVLFVDATDVIRILGKYPEDVPPEPTPRGGVGSGSTPFRRRRERKANVILAMAPLPLGTCPHRTDGYNLIAMVTPVKLVIVGLKPKPTTWYRRLRRDNEEGGPRDRWTGTLAWFPSVESPSPTPENPPPKDRSKLEARGTMPMLIFSWGKQFHLIRVSEKKVIQSVKNAKTGKISEAEFGAIVIEEVSTWTADEVVLAVRWLSANQILVLTPNSLQVHDVDTKKLVERSWFSAPSLMSPTLSQTASGSVTYADSVLDVSHSIWVYKTKIFILGKDMLQVGTLLTWADRILAFVMEGDFLNAIQLTRSYYVGEAEGNRNGLPEDPEALKEEVGTKMRELMTASARYAFSEDRLTDSTHVTPDNRGVDRTSMFENMVSTCVRACLTLGDLDFVFEDLFQHYDDSGISRIYLTQLEPFILDGSISQVPPRITQRIIAMHAEDGHPDLAEQVIWHIDPLCLDINQAISLCQTHHLYDALIYVYTRALQDYVSPIVVLIGFIRKVQQFRWDRAHRGSVAEMSEQEAAIEPYVVNAYKIYPYLSDVLTGMTYPSEEPLSDLEASRAKKDIYTFLFFGRSSVWPVGEGGKLVLTSDEEGGVEPTYPYLRLLLRFDAESLLNSLDLAFEDSYLNDETRGVSRLVIIKVLLDILSSSDLAPADTMFINIFIARNVPKYPQFIQISPSALHDILISLAEYPDESTREDRQLAAEFLLSVHTPHEGERLQQIFEEAGFYRILRSWHRQEQMWRPLIFAYLHDPELRASEVFSAVEDILKESSRSTGTVSSELHDTLSDALPDLLDNSVTSAALVIEKFAPDLHQKAIDILGGDASPQQFAYLRRLFGLPSLHDDLSDGWRAVTPSPITPQSLRLLYVGLQCELDRPNVITALKQFPVDFFEWPDVINICEAQGVYDAVVWCLDWNAESEGALKKANFIHRDLTAEIIGNWDPGESSRDEIIRRLDTMVAVSQQAIRICLRYSRLPDPPTTVNVQDMWFELLKSQVECVQAISANIALQGHPATQDDDENQLLTQEDTLTRLRALVQDTFSSLVSVSSSHRISFPKLFKRLVDSATQTSKETHYNEFRTILTGMMESYRSDGDILTITKQILDRDVFDTVEELTKVRSRGWRLARGATCSSCGKGLLSMTGGGPPTDGFKLSLSGVAYHASCSQKIAA